ncbi:MAG: DUF2007 domain-containing protein [bacterium]
MEGLQLLTTLSTDFEAELIKQKLSAAGIECFIQSSDADGMLPLLENGVPIYVEPYDFDKATELIADVDELPADDLEVGVVD